MVGVPEDRKVEIRVANRIDGFRDEKMVLERNDGEIDSDQPPNFTSPLAGGVDDDLRADIALRCLNKPGPALALEARDRRVANDLGAARSSAFRESHGHTGRVDIAIRFEIGSGEDSIGIEEREEFESSLGRDDFEREAQGVRDPFAVMELFDSFLGAGEPYAPAAAKVDRLSGLGFERLIVLDAVLEKLHHVVAGVELSAEPRRMPCRPTGQLVFFNQDGVGEPELSQVVEQAATTNTTTDNDDLRFTSHIPTLCIDHSRNARQYTLGSENFAQESTNCSGRCLQVFSVP